MAGVDGQDKSIQSVWTWHMTKEPCDECGAETTHITCAAGSGDVLRCVKCGHEQFIEQECKGKCGLWS